MSVQDSSTVDAIGVDRGTGKVVLTIADHLDWEDEPAHLLTLQAKINSYLSFIESGEIEEAYPDARGRARIIDVVYQYKPTDTAQRFHQKVITVLARAGVEFRARVLASGNDPR